MKNKRNDMQIVLASDANYLPFAYVTIDSVLQQRKERYFIYFSIMVPKNTTPISLDEAWQFEDYSISYFEVPDEFFGNLEMSISHITKPTYYRLIISRLLNEDITRCLYLDTDIIVRDDLIQLYEIDFGDNYIIAGKCSELIANNERQKKYAAYLEIPDTFSYVNAGVILFNLSAIRKDKITNYFLESSKKNWICQDQDVINSCCYGKTSIFSYRYNIYSFAFGVNSKWLECTLKKEEINMAMKNPAIIHYATKEAKPWFNLMGSQVNLWWNVAKLALSADMYKSFYQNAIFQTNLIEIPYYIGEIERLDKLIVFGYGIAGKEFLLYMKQINPTCNIIIFDNKIVESNSGEMKVMKPIYLNDDKIRILVTVQKNQEEIVKQLVELGYCKEQIIKYVQGDMGKWFSIAPEYRALYIEKYDS